MEKHSDEFFVVKDEAGLTALPTWLQKREYTTFRDGLVDKNHRPMVGLKYGKEKRGLILCVAAELRQRVLDLVEDHRILTVTGGAA